MHLWKKVTQLEKKLFHLLVDTCVWLDLAKNHRQQALLGVLEELIQEGRLKLLLPRIVCDEFSRNRTRVVEESGRSLSGVLRQVQEMVEKFGDEEAKQVTLEQLREVNYRIPILGGKAVESISRIERLFALSDVIESSDNAKLQAAQRALENKAPFHRNRNSMGDAILIETYSECVKNSLPDDYFLFVTHNKKDFSHPEGDDNLPHPEIAESFDDNKSFYFLNLATALQTVEPELISEMMIEQEWLLEELRRLTEVAGMIGELVEKVWYDRHCMRRNLIEEGKIKLVDEASEGYDPGTIRRDIWAGALKAAAAVEEEYGIENLGPYSDFQWGILNGKLSALRWILGDEWDNLDT